MSEGARGGPIWCALIATGLLACSRGDAASERASAPAPPAVPSAPTSGSTEASAGNTENDGTDPKAPVLAPGDVGFADPRKGFGWGDRCFREIKEGKLGWARAACDRALALPEVDPKAKPALLFNEGLIAEKSGEEAAARGYFTQSLALRPPNDPGRAAVEKELVSVGGKVEKIEAGGGKSFPCGGGAVCNEDQICCQAGSHASACFTSAQIPDWCMLPVALRGACDPRTNRPCAASEKCCLQLRPVARAANPVCVDEGEAEDCAK